MKIVASPEMAWLNEINGGAAAGGAPGAVPHNLAFSARIRGGKPLGENMLRRRDGQ
jgi:hypothetical protein